ncbi:MAG: hypothetical protein ACFFBP_06600 [Promethearchaeota archaeon]
MMEEIERKKMISYIHEFGGIGLRHQTIRVHKNGAKLPISKVYLDDEILNPESSYTVILIPEIKLATRISVLLSYFSRRFGPTPFIIFPEQEISENEMRILAQNMAEATKKEFFVYLSNVIPSTLNYYFEINSEWARGNKEMLMITIMVNKPIIPLMEEDIQEICVKFAEKVKNIEGAFKALYLKDINSFQEKDRSDIIKINENMQVNLKKFYNEISVLL